MDESDVGGTEQNDALGSGNNNDSNGNSFGTGTTYGTGNESFVSVPSPSSDPYTAAFSSNEPNSSEQPQTTNSSLSPAEVLNQQNADLIAAEALSDQQQQQIQHLVAVSEANNPETNPVTNQGADQYNTASEISGTLGDNADPFATAVEVAVNDQASGTSGFLPDPNQSGQQCVADPINPFNGQLVLESDDLRIDGAGMDFLFHRTYKNQVLYSGPLGSNWSHSYNIRLREGDDTVWLTTGDLREEAYTRHPLFGAPGFSYFVPPDGRHAVIIPLGDSFVRRMPDGTRYIMERYPAGNDRHRIQRIEDKCGNFLEFSYNGDLLTNVVVNHPDRAVTLSYDDGRRISGVSDWTGRVWRYEYDDNNDLVAVTTPAMAPYPDGLTTRYEYDDVPDSGFLQHNLIRVLDPSGQEVLFNEYGRIAGLSSFNRVIRQRQGNGEATFEYELVDQEFDESYTDAQRPATQTNYFDRNGHPIHFVYNAAGNLVLKEEMVVEENRLRHLIWRYRYNQDGALTASLSPEGVLTQSYFGRDAYLREYGIEDNDVATDPHLTQQLRLGFGRLLATVRRAAKKGFDEMDQSLGVWGDVFPDVLGAPDPLDIVTKYTYEPDFGQLLTVSDPRYTSRADPNFAEGADFAASLTRYYYKGAPGDPFGLLDRISRPTPTAPDGTVMGSVVEQFPTYDFRGRLLEHIDPSGIVTDFTYFGVGDGELEGYLKQMVIDDGGLAITAQYERDTLGRVTAVHSPRSASAAPGTFTTRQKYDELDRLIQSTGSAPFFFVTRTFYDPASRVSRIERDAKDDTGADIPNAPEVRNKKYDPQGNLLQETLGGSDASTDLITQYCYDAADQLILTVMPSGNRIRRYYSERMLPTYITSGDQTPDAATSRMTYDGDGNLRATASALGRPTSWTLDAFGRTTAIRDPVGNEVRRSYDKAGNLLVERVFELQSDGSYMLVSRSESVYDVLSRRISFGRNLFDAPIPSPHRVTDFLGSPGPGRILATQFYYDANGRMVRSIDPMNRIQEVVYDAVGRVIQTTDPIGTQIQSRYDAEGNLVRRDVHEIVRDMTTGQVIGEEIFSSTAIFDELNRQISTTDSLGNVSSFGYDSRGNILKKTDPLGNVTRYSYDIYGRRGDQTVELTSTGLGGGPPLPPAISTFVYDSNGNLVQTTDSLGRMTVQKFDGLDRRAVIVYPDQSVALTEYDRDSSLLRTTDPNNVKCTYSTDSLGRVKGIDVDTSGVQPGLQIEGFSFAKFKFDALGNLRRDENDFVLREVARNSIGWAISEQVQYQTAAAPFALPLTLTRTFNDAGATKSLTYPGGRLLLLDRDDTDQLKRVTTTALGQKYPGTPNQVMPAPLASVHYNGSRPVNIRFGNGAGTKIGYDGARRRITFSQELQNNPFGSIQQLWDGAGSVRLRANIVPGASSGERFEYDSRYWLTGSVELAGVPPIDPSKFAPSVVLLPDPIPKRQAAIDAAIIALAAGVPPSSWQYDLAGNRIREIPSGQPPLIYATNKLDQYVAVGAAAPTYDMAGNQMSNGVLDFRYDALNRLVRVVDSHSGVDLAEFFHDALGRRALVISEGTARHLFSDGVNVIAEYIGGALSSQFVHADAPDTPLQIAAEGTEHWFHLDGTNTVRFLSNSQGAVDVSYTYSPFGVSSGGVGPYNPLRFSARPLDHAIGSYDFRTRQYDPQRGRFLQRDRAAKLDGSNLYTFAANNPASLVDPMGTDPSSSAGDSLKSPSIDTFHGSTSGNRDFNLNLVDSLQNTTPFDLNLGQWAQQLDLMYKIDDTQPAFSRSNSFSIKPGARDVGGLNSAPLSVTESGVPYASDSRIREYVDLAAQFIDDHLERIIIESGAMNLPVSDRDIAFAKAAIQNAQVVSFEEARKIDPTIRRENPAFYQSGSIYLREDFVNRWIQGQAGVRVWEELIHEGKHALLDSALGGSRLTEETEHSLFEWIYPYYIGE